MNTESVVKKIDAVADICLYVFGAIGCFGFAVKVGSVPCAVGVLALAVQAFPTFKKNLNKLRK